MIAVPGDCGGRVPGSVDGDDGVRVGVARRSRVVDAAPASLQVYGPPRRDRRALIGVSAVAVDVVVVDARGQNPAGSVVVVKVMVGAADTGDSPVGAPGVAGAAVSIRITRAAEAADGFPATSVATTV